MGHLLPDIATTAPGLVSEGNESHRLTTTSINVPSKSALLVEKNESLLHLLRRNLVEMGYAVRTAPDKTEALRLYRDFAPSFNVVLINYSIPECRDSDEAVDYCAPRTSGMELARSIRGMDPSQGMVILAFDFERVGDVPRPPELTNVPLVVDMSRPQLRIVLEKIEVDRAVKALTPAEQLRLKGFAMFRVRGLGRAAGTRDWEDLLQEALYRTLIGATDTRNGRHWNKKVNLVKHLEETMRSIANSWKRQFTGPQASTYLASEFRTLDDEGEEYSPLDNLASGQPLTDQELIEAEEENRMLRTLRDDPDATVVLLGWMNGLRKNEILAKYSLDEKSYAAAVRRMRLKLLGSRGGDNES